MAKLMIDGWSFNEKNQITTLELTCPLCETFIGWATVDHIAGELVLDVLQAESELHETDCVREVN